MSMQARRRSDVAISRPRAFTLIELLVVMAILATLLSIAAPRYFASLERAKEEALKTDLRVLRESIDKHRADTGRFPDTLERLAELRYLRSVPTDPMTESVTSWVLVAHPDGVTPGIYDVRSGASGQARDGSTYASWVARGPRKAALPISGCWWQWRWWPSG
jgi:general secretion pathway protein G